MPEIGLAHNYSAFLHIELGQPCVAALTSECVTAQLSIPERTHGGLPQAKETGGYTAQGKEVSVKKEKSAVQNDCMKHKRPPVYVISLSSIPSSDWHTA
jgi:hypothetical protein